MEGLNFHILCKKALRLSLQRNLHSGYVLSARQKRKTVQYSVREPGVEHRKKLIGDTDFHQSESFGDDFVEEESLDFENIDKAYDEDQWEKKKHRIRVDTAIIYNKYFAPPRQPGMLTTNEIECIKYLHESDPINWDVRALSESFPAIPETIKKILKSHYKLSPERAKRKDEVVHKNWELLAEGKLEADPKIIEHCKKFINRREVLLEQIKNTKLYLPKIKEEPRYNSGEMSNILLHYEKRLEELKKAKESKMLPEESKPEKEKERYLDLLHKEVEKVMSKRINKKESSFLRKVVNSYAKEITFEELANKAIQRTEKNQKIDLAEKAILETKFGVSKQYFEDPEEKIEKIKPKSIPQKMLKTETSMKIEEKSKEYKLDSLEDDLPDLPSPDARTRFAKETGVGQLLSNIKNPVEPEKAPDNYVIADVETIAKENERFDKQVDDIKNTPFWNNNLGSKEKAELELQKEPIKAPSECKRITKSDMQVPDEYPLRIPVPRSKRGSGLTFRVNDCFYDDDGEFLYRVPGMLVKKVNS